MYNIKEQIIIQTIIINQCKNKNVCCACFVDTCCAEEALSYSLLLYPLNAIRMSDTILMTSPLFGDSPDCRTTLS